MIRRILRGSERSRTHLAKKNSNKNCKPKICDGLVKVLQLKNQFSGRLLARKIPITAICLGFLRTVFPVEVFELIVAETNLNVAIQENADKESKDPDWNEWQAKRINSRRTESIPGSANSDGNHRVFAIAPELP